MPDEIVIQDAPPGAAPGIGFGDLIQFAPIIEQVIAAITGAVSSGGTTIPAIKIRIHGQRVTLGPCPIRVGE